MNKKIHTLLVCGILLLALKAKGQSIDPYLQAITANSIAVNWKTAATATPVVRYGLTETSLNNTINGTTEAIDDPGSGYVGNYFYHTVKLRNLQPATKYYYRVVSGSDSSTISSFRTLPTAGTAPNASGRMRFLILGDNQIKAQPRYDSLMVSARRKMQQLYGPNFNDSVSFILNLGDQVDVGTLDHYDNVHLKKSRYLSNVLPIQTAIGNHETYGTLQLSAYYKHFVLDSMSYKGIYSGTEDYYAFQAGNVVIVYTYTESAGTTNTQFNWVKRVVDSATADPTVKWIITIGHRPYQAEQYVGDISPWIRNTVVPYVMQSPKFFMHVGAHHHLYARGQMKDVPGYNIISGGTAWDQYWGMATEQNFDDVQKTISQWAYQLVDVDMVNDKMDVTTYSIGSIYQHKDNVVIDSFHRYKNLALPTKPEITNTYADSLQLPLTLTASAFQSTAGELLNSSEFQVAADRNFAVPEKTGYRHYQDLFGAVPGANPDTTKDQNLGLNISAYTLGTGAVTNGWHYARVRYRDRNMSWSPWSDTDSFKVYNSVFFNPSVKVDTNRILPGNPVRVTFTNGSTNAAAWIGIYRKGQTPSSSSPSVTWQNTGGPNGTLNFNLTTADEYFVAYFGDGGYTEIATRVPFYYGPSPVLTTSAPNYNVGQTVPIQYSNCPVKTNDWIGVYKIGMTPGGPASVKWTYITATNGTYNVTGLQKGYYFATYMLRDQYFEAGPRTFFSVGDTITTLTTNKTTYNLGEYISATWVDGPGNPKDWLGIYADTANYDNFVSYTYIDGHPSGGRNIPDSSMPQQVGNYFIVMFTNDSYDEVSNRVYFQMVNNPLPLHLIDFAGKTEGMAHLLNWKMAGEEPGERYILQHSTDAKNYTDIYETGMKHELRGNYSYLYDKAVPGDNFYRLRLLTSDGSQTLSQVVQLHLNDKGENTVSVYPNPTRAGNRSVIESPYPIDQIDIVDISGQLIYQTKNINDNKFSLLHHDLPAGTYIIRIHSRKLYTAKLVITN
ncbi:fibronectin type III domain-containing protein [Taibaiella chishuiensis]|uniref:Putative secreted protein (Por secretion system target) n=1 Tax=Taibaiella chishuiensis TaxID=1434707 RepID=A0A2P8DDB9_9BACT|nr:fibronectin type III domain-containing protein [Taibaiella chishuiensis]PSK95216.1 putative secreted protein (Por secretion system target) [Taibaiella chishuiensis]